MATYTRLVFSEQAFHDEVMRIGDQALDDAVAHILGNEWFKGSTPNQASRDGMETYFEIPANDLKAWIIEYGQGQSADIKRNPYWKQYVESGLTHENRRDNSAVLKRGLEGYDTVDFHHNQIVHYNKGGEPSGEKVDPSLQKALDKKPKPFLQDLLKEAFEVFKSSFNSNMQNFNVQRCFITAQETV